jgi:uncharacterized protein YfaS (alpha-2-macroglobulin family)
MTTAELDQLIARHRAALLQRDTATLMQMAERWQQVEQALQGNIDALIADIRQRGWTTVSPSRLAQLERYQQLLQQAQAQVAAYAQATAPRRAMRNWHCSTRLRCSVLARRASRSVRSMCRRLRRVSALPPMAARWRGC